METANYIDFKRERDLGDILGDSFAFLRYNYKPLFQVIFKLVGPILLVLLLAVTGYLYLMFGQGVGLFSILSSNPENVDTVFGQFFGMTLLVGVVIIAISVLFYAVFYASINYAIKSYIDHQGTILFDEVAANVRRTWGRFTGISLLAGLMVVVGLFFCIIPGIYLYVPLSLVFAIMAFYDMGVGDSIAYCFKLIKSNWWMSFLTLFIMGIIYYLGSSIFQVPVFIYSLVKAMTVSQDIAVGGTADLSEIVDWIYILLSLIAYIARYVFYVLMIICSTFIFFNLNEKKNKTGAYEAIESLGADRVNK